MFPEGIESHMKNSGKSEPKQTNKQTNKKLKLMQYRSHYAKDT